MSNPNSKSLSNPIGTFHINNTFDTKWFMASLLMTVQTEGNMGIDSGKSNATPSEVKS
jgi:hypothetical protein